MENLCECGNELYAKGKCKKCYYKLYRQENPEKEKQYQKRYYQKNAEKIKQMSKRYYQENPEKIKRYRQENAEKIKQMHKRYRKELNDNYVIRILTKCTTLSAKDIRQYPELIELKRADLQVKRQLIK